MAVTNHNTIRYYYSSVFTLKNSQNLIKTKAFVVLMRAADIMKPFTSFTNEK